MDCRCSHRKPSCIRVFGVCDKRIFYKISEAESEDESGDKLDGEDESISVKYKSTSPDEVYSPLIMCTYLNEEKRIPLRDANSRTHHPVACMKFIPHETTLGTTALYH